MKDKGTLVVISGFSGAGKGTVSKALVEEVSAALLAGEKVGFFSEFPCEGELPKGLIWHRPCIKPLISFSNL